MIEEKLKSIIVYFVEGVDTNSISDETNLLDDLGFDSVDLIKFVVKIEEAFDIEIDDDDLELDRLIVFGELVNLISELKE